MTTKRTIVLAIDGGGIRGIIPLTILRYIEEKLERPAFEIFDVLVGTSTGALIATLLTLPVPHSAENALKIYKRFGKEVFRSGWLKRNLIHWVHGTRYSNRNLSRVLETLTGTLTLGELKSTVAFPAYDMKNEKRVIYDTYHYDHKNYRISNVLRSCVAAPTYFKPFSVDSCREAGPPLNNVYQTLVRRKLHNSMSLVDGGVFANNASSFAYNFVRKTVNSVKSDASLFLLSLGTGTKKRDTTRQSSIPSCSLAWCTRFAEVMLMSESQEIDDEIKTVLGKRYVRIQGEVRDHRLDGTSRERLRILEEDAARILEEHKSKIDAFCALLKEQLQN